MHKIKKNYSSYEQINLDLEVLKTERDLAYHYIIRAAKNGKNEIKNSFTPLNIIKKGIQSFTTTNKIGIKGILIPILLQFILGKLKK